MWKGNELEEDDGYKQKKQKTTKDIRNAAAGAQQKTKARKGNNGVLLKKYESVMLDMFSTKPSSTSSKYEICQEALYNLTPRYSKLPSFINDTDKQKLVDIAKKYWKSRCLTPSSDVCNDDSPWPFDKETSLPQCGCVRESSNTTRDVGDVKDIKRAWRKEMQLANLIQCVLTLIPDDILQNEKTNKRTFRVIDFAGGTGHLAVPLALLLPQVEVVCVDLKQYSLDLLHKRVDGMPLSSKKDDSVDSIQVSTTLPNLSTYYGSIQTYPYEFDIGVSLHACGEASDLALRKCLNQKASFVVCSCCCGKLQSEAKNPYVFQSTGGNDKEISYPQSKKMIASLERGADQEVIGSSKVHHNKPANRKQQEIAFDEIAKASDYSEIGDIRKPKNACRRAAKALVEWDRLLYARECMESSDSHKAPENVILSRMVPWECSVKNDVLIGWFEDSCNPYRQQSKNSISIPDDTSCDEDFKVALNHLFGNNARSSGSTTSTQNDWTSQEEKEVTSEIEQFISDSSVSQEYRFVKGMGARKRKLIHSVAEKLSLRHWSEGKGAEKIVVVARRRTSSQVDININNKT